MTEDQEQDCCADAADYGGASLLNFVENGCKQRSSRMPCHVPGNFVNHSPRCCKVTTAEASAKTRGPNLLLKLTWKIMGLKVSACITGLVKYPTQALVEKL